MVIGNDEIFEAHVGGKLSVELKTPLDTRRALSIAYTPGVAQVSRAIAADPVTPWFAEYALAEPASLVGQT
jgi:malate dehydrogenase (oxaloacetate-decarboxylating)